MNNRDIVTCIAMYLDMYNIHKLCNVNKYYNILFNDDYFWYLLVNHQYPDIPYYKYYKNIYSDIDFIKKLISHFINVDNDKIKEWLLLNHRQQYATHFNSIVLSVMDGYSPNAFVKVFHLYLNNKQIYINIPLAKKQYRIIVFLIFRKIHLGL